MSVTRTAAAIALALALLAPLQSLTAQRHLRGGLWGEAGSGPSHLRIMSCTDCIDVDRSVGSAFYSRAGILISDKVLLGLELYAMEGAGEVFAGSGESIIARSTSVNFIALWYPWRGGTFFKGGLGPAAGKFTIRNGADAPFVSRSSGVGLTFGVGYDRPLTNHLALTGSAATWIAAIGDLILPGDRTVDDVIASNYGLTLGLTIR